MYNTDNQRHLNDEFSPIRMMMIFKKDNTSENGQNKNYHFSVDLTRFSLPN